MSRAWERARRGAVFLGAVFVSSVWAFHWMFQKSMLESIYWTVITIAGVGYSQSVDTEVPDSRQFLSIMVIVFGMLAMAYTLAMLVQAIVEGQLDKVLGAKKMSKEIEKLQQHVIVCGFGRIGQNLTQRLARHGVSFLVIDPNPDAIAVAKTLGYICLEADATDEGVLTTVGLDRAATIVLSIPSDPENVFLTLTIRNLNPKITIVARGEDPRTEKKLLQAGADQVVMPAIIGAERIADIIVRPEASELLRCVGHESGFNAELEEFTVADSSPALGQPVRQTAAEHQLMIVAIRRASGETIFNPNDEERFDEGDIVVVMGPEADIEHFYEAHIACTVASCELGVAGCGL